MVAESASPPVPMGAPAKPAPSVGPWVIGGPARCGKSTLVNALAAIDCAIAGLPVEGLLPNYFARQGQGAALVHEYLERPRWLDGARTVAARPIDAFLSSLDEVVAASKVHGKPPLAAVARALDRFAEDHGRASWAVADLHPELCYHKLQCAIPALRLAVVVRDPRESLCGALYWRTYPKRHPDGRRLLLYSLALWCLAAETATLLAASDPNRVLILRFNRLVAGDPSELEAATQAFGATPHSLHAALPARPDFTRLTDGRFVVPDGTIKSLLTASETALIESVAGPWMLRLGLVQGAFAVTERTSGVRAMRALVASLTSLGRAAPAAAKSLADFIFYPGRTVRRGARQAEAKLRRVFGRGRTAPTSGCADL